MPVSARERSDDADRRLAIWAEALYLVNLLPAPVIGFVILAGLFFTRRASAGPLGTCHLWQTLAASIWAGVLIVGVAGVILAIGGAEQPATWVALLLYVVVVHSAFILLGVIGLTRAMAGQPYRYPLIGPQHCDRGSSGGA